MSMRCRTEPLVAVLENVYGLMEVWPEASPSFVDVFDSELMRNFSLKFQAEKKFKNEGILGDYFMAVVKTCPSRLGEPVTRRRVYILFLRKIPSCNLKVASKRIAS